MRLSGETTTLILLFCILEPAGGILPTGRALGCGPGGTLPSGHTGRYSSLSESLIEGYLIPDLEKEIVILSMNRTNCNESSLVGNAAPITINQLSLWAASGLPVIGPLGLGQAQC